MKKELLTKNELLKNEIEKKLKDIKNNINEYDYIPVSEITIFQEILYCLENIKQEATEKDFNPEDLFGLGFVIYKKLEEIDIDVIPYFVEDIANFSYSDALSEDIMEEINDNLTHIFDKAVINKIFDKLEDIEVKLSELINSPAKTDSLYKSLVDKCYIGNSNRITEYYTVDAIFKAIDIVVTLKWNLNCYKLENVKILDSLNIEDYFNLGINLINEFDCNLTYNNNLDNIIENCIFNNINN